MGSFVLPALQSFVSTCSNRNQSGSGEIKLSPACCQDERIHFGRGGGFAEGFSHDNKEPMQSVSTVARSWLLQLADECGSARACAAVPGVEK